MVFRIIIISLFFVLKAFGQEIKPIYYQDVDGNIITEEIFIEKKRYSKKKKNNYLALTFENDTCYVRKLFYRKNYGKLKKSDLDTLHKGINNGKPKEKFSIILYHPGKDNCNGGRTFVKGRNGAFTVQHRKKWNRKSDFTIFMIHKKDENIDFSQPKSMQWKEDKNQIVEITFFKFHYPCSSFVIVNNENGNFISFFGEFGASTVKELAEEMLEKF